MPMSAHRLSPSSPFGADLAESNDPRRTNGGFDTAEFFVV